MGHVTMATLSVSLSYLSAAMRGGGEGRGGPAQAHHRGGKYLDPPPRPLQAFGQSGQQERMD